MSDSVAAETGSGESAPVDEAHTQAFLEEIERAAERLRRLPLTDLTPEVPYRPQWTESAE
ncbi:MAG TPA: hypothetical protein VFU81_22210 [Thermomicrobiales bacterium]|nr:hypothetical protein [Thermomicrobiales bacterium]